MRLLGLDLGEKAIGVAVSDLMGWTAQGLTTIWRSGLKQDLANLNRLVREYEAEGFVVGLPRRTDGSYGPESDKVIEFGEELKREFGLPVEYWDERFSTVSAERILLEGDLSRAKRRRVIDKVAAAIILQAYLDHKGKN
ncbi:MAG: Holliday junction resolvase RuvX [Firmicutes bacterium]|nr:Holliday junction resolvase RuvX [Bacillota bacterium]